MALLAGYIAAGVAVTWPLASYLRGRLPDIEDPASYVWSLWWVAHQITHLGNPWFTPRLAAPAGVQLGYDTLMPLLGLLMLPVTLLAGPALSYNLLVLVLPGAACYALYRVARLWLPSAVGAVAAGALFGLSTMVTFQDWFHLNIAAGTVFLPLALEASVRLRRRPGIPRALRAGVVLGLAVLVNQESAIMAAILVVLALGPWLASRPSLDRLRDCGVVALAAFVVASPQIAAMAWQSGSGGAAAAASQLPDWYRRLGAGLPTLFSPSPRLRSWGLASLASGFHFPLTEGVPAFGVTLTVLALAGLVISWRRRSARRLGLLWLGSAALAMGSALKIGTTSYLPAAVTLGGVRLSGVLPFTWLVQVPGLAAFREADRFTLLGLVPAALLGGSTLGWLATRARPLLTRGGRRQDQGGPGRRPAADCGGSARPWRLAGPAAGRSGSPFLPRCRPWTARSPRINPARSWWTCRSASGAGCRSATAPRSTRRPWPWPARTVTRGPSLIPPGSRCPRWRRSAATRSTRGWPPPRRATPAMRGRPAWPGLDARRMDVGWVLVWHATPWVLHYLAQTGFRFDYRADRVSVYRPAAPASGTGQQHDM